MEKALGDLKELQTMFDSQASSFDAAATSCTDALGALDKSWGTRKEWLEEWEHIGEKIPEGGWAKQVNADCTGYRKVHELQGYNNRPGLKKRVTLSTWLYIMIQLFHIFINTKIVLHNKPKS